MSPIGEHENQEWLEECVSTTWQLHLYERQQLVHSTLLFGSAELGRQTEASEPLFEPQGDPGQVRVALAPLENRSVSRRQLRIEPLPDGQFRITNLSVHHPLVLSDGRTIGPGCPFLLAAEGLVRIGSLAIRVEPDHPDNGLHRLIEATRPPGTTTPLPSPASGSSHEVKLLLPWLHALVDLLQSAATAEDFFDRAARAVVELIGLDSGRVLLWRDEEWLSQAHFPTGPEAAPEPNPGILQLVRQERRAFWETRTPGAGDALDQEPCGAIVAAPLLDQHGKVIGALYGDRRSRERPISEREALLVELMARGVAGGLVRLQQEQARTLFAQFFPPKLATQLAARPDLLEGRRTEVTVLLCDVRGFSRVCERFDPDRTVEWIGQVMGELSHCVHVHDGVLVDYHGDELLAMWGAPEDQPNHARLACQAALAMLQRLPALNKRWQAALGEPTSLSIGINSGPAYVGNTGSRFKFKYGPLGHTVNLASRVQSATRQLDCKLLITGATRAILDSSFVTRRLCDARLVNIQETVSLHEVGSANQAGWREACREYNTALELFESQQFGAAARALGNWCMRQPEDGPALQLMHRAVSCMVAELNPFDPVLVLKEK